MGIKAMQFVIPLPPVTKKNSQRILYRWVIDSKTGKRKRVPFIAPSEAYERYGRLAAHFIPRMYTFNEPVNIKCLFYMQTRRKCDLTNLLEAVDDILVGAGLLADDNYTVIEAHDGSRVYYDPDAPRTEIYIERVGDKKE